MVTTRITSDLGEIERWAGEYDAVPVRDGDDLAIVEAGDVGLDQERLRWGQFDVEGGDDTVVVLERRTDGPDTMAAVDRETFFERVDLPEADRRDALAKLEDGKTVTLTGSDGDTEIVDEAVAASATDAATNEPTEWRGAPDDRDVGKIVVAPDGDEVGMVTAVEDEAIHVDPHPGLAESALATLGWSGIDDEDVRVDADRIDHVTPGVVRLGEEPAGGRFEETTAGR